MKKSKLSKAEQLAKDVVRWKKTRDVAIKMLIRAMDHLVMLDRKQQRLLKRELKNGNQEVKVEVPATPVEDDVPEFLDRQKQLQAMPDPRSKERNAERRAVAKEVREAELTGKRRKLPLSGKAAIAEIAKG